MNIFTTAFFFSIFRIATPILFATLAAVIGEKGGVSNIGLEGIMMMSALFGSLTAYWTGQWWIGVLAAMVVGCAEALLMGFFAFKLKTDIILTGTAVNMIGSGGTLFLVKVITQATEGQSYYKTPLGLNIRSVGENPNAASSVGVSVNKIRYITIGIGGILAGLGGAYMSMYYAMGWSLDMVAGRGFIALAAQSMGGGEPLGSMFAALIFGFAQALGIKVSSTGVDSNLVAPIPYIVTILALIVFALLQRRNEKKRHDNALQ